MAKFDADLTDPPAVSTDNVGETARGWVGYLVVASMAALALGVATNTVVPTLTDVANMLPGINAGDGSGNINVGVNGGGL